LTGIDPILLAQLQGLAGSGRLNELLSGTPPPPPALPEPIQDEGRDQLEEEFNYDLIELNIQLTNIDLLAFVIASSRFTEITWLIVTFGTD
jgi:hypothetical protein